MLFYGQLLTKRKLLYLNNYYSDLLLPIITRIISNFHHVLVLIRAFQKYYDLLRDILPISAFFALLSNHIKVIEGNFLYEISKNRYERYFI